jgi:polyadenylate-binding protein
MTYEDLSALSPVVRKEVLSGELQRRLKEMENVNTSDVDAIVDSLVGMSLADIVDAIQDSNKLTEQVQNVQSALKGEDVKEQPTKTPSPSVSQGSSNDANALTAASAPEHPSTPVTLSSNLSTPPRVSSPSAGGSERERIYTKVSKLESDPAKATEITELLMSLSKRERAMCLFSDEVFRAKVSDAKAVLETDDAEEETTKEQGQRASSVPPVSAPAPVTPVRKSTSSSAMPTVSGTTIEDSPKTPDLSSRGPSATASPAAPSTPSTSALGASTGAYTVETLAKLPATKIIELANTPSVAAGLSFLPKADALVVKATDEFVDSLAGLTVPKQKQAVGDKL